MELESSFSGTTSLGGKSLCKPTCQTRWLKNKGAILILAWSFFAMSVVHYYSISEKRDTLSMQFKRPKGSELIAMGTLLIIGGCLADAHFGRYRVICCGIWIMWIGSLLSAFSVVLSKVFMEYKTHGDKWVSLSSKFIMGFGFGLFQSNIIQFGVDQLSEASSAEITSFITCYVLTFFISSFTMYYSAKCSPDYVGVLVLTVCLTLALCSYFLFNHLLVKEQVIQNPLPLIWKIVRYSIRNNHLQQKFSSIKDHGVLSRLDIAKTLYTGPFTCEQVEDTKTFFRALAVIVASTIAHTGISDVNMVKDGMLQHFLDWPNASISVSACYEGLSIIHFSVTFTIVVILMYLVIIQPVFYNYIPKVNMTTKFIIAIVLFFIRIISFLGIESASYCYQLRTNSTNIAHCYLLEYDRHVVDLSFYWITFPEALNGLSLFVLLLAGMEFVCAQVPFYMKGLVFGISYAVFGFGTLIQTTLLFPFLYVKETVWENAPLTCGIWYFLIQTVIVLVCFVGMMVVIRGYKNRIRINNYWQEIHSDD